MCKRLTHRYDHRLLTGYAKLKLDGKIWYAKNPVYNIAGIKAESKGFNFLAHGRFGVGWVTSEFKPVDRVPPTVIMEVGNKHYRQL